MERIYEILASVNSLKNTIIKDECFGCQNWCPSQKDHPCLYLDQNSTYNYSVQALYQLLAENSITVAEFDQVYNMLNVSSSSQ